MSEYLAPAFAVVLPNLGGIAGSYFTRKNIPIWYENLKKPDWCPPNKAFAPIWTYLYSSMGYASFLVWRDGGGFQGDNRLPLALYGTQLALNWIWSPIFFGAKSLKWGLVDIVFTWGSVAGTIVTFYPVNKVAAGLMVPYLGWVSLATALNYVIWRDNKGLVEIVFMWGAVAGTIVTFYPVNKVAAGLMVPYLGWVSLATALNYVVWRDNKDRTD